MEIEVKENKLWKLLLSLRTIPSKTIWSIILIYLVGSFFYALKMSEANILSAAGGVTTILGLLQFIALTTPLTEKELEVLASGINQSKFDILKIHNLQVRGLEITILGTLIWAYGWLLPV